MAQNGTSNGQKRVEAEQNSYNREHPVVFGQKREKVGVGQSDTANNTLCHYCFQVHKSVLANQISPTTLSATIGYRYTRFSPKKYRELLFLAIAKKKRRRQPDSKHRGKTCRLRLPPIPPQEREIPADTQEIQICLENSWLSTFLEVQYSQLSFRVYL